MRFIAIVIIAASACRPSSHIHVVYRAEYRHLGREKEGQTEKREGRIYAGGAREIATASRA